MKYNLNKSHPWHGISSGENFPNAVTAFVEIVPTDTVKYEIDKDSGYLKIDRPQKYSNQCPMLYGFIPQTYCGNLVGEYCANKIGQKNILGDGDPIDICILTEKVITHGNIIVSAIPIGGLRMIDNREADDKIIAVLENDAVYGNLKDVSELPQKLVDRLRHYFLTYKQSPDDKEVKVDIASVYSAEEAREVIIESQRDYKLLIK